MENFLVKLDSVDKSYYLGGEKIVVLSDADMLIRQSDFTAIMGPSGSGKTTLLNLIGGVDRIDAGEIWYENTRYDNLKERKLTGWRADHVGFIFQYYNLLPSLTAAQNIELPLLLRDMRKSERTRRVNASLALVGLTDRAKHKPDAMSGGQQQRVAIARAIVADSPLILCDEPTGNLDRKASDEILEILRILNAEYKKTIIVVTHDEHASSFMDKKLRLEDGKILED
jgi:putative ABC transport system ATP-binding protein